MMRRFLAPLLGALTLALSGCLGYHLGPTNGTSAGARSIQIDPFVNKTLQPGLVDNTMNSLRKNLQQDGTYRLDTHEEGDIVLTGVITSYSRSTLSVNPTDVLTAVDYQITMTARITARDRITGKIILDRPVTGTASLSAGNDLTSAERQAIPLLTDDLARRATAMLVDGTW
jgi:outer membrane lipopolysaccharide assembly protein LptE/RlpB